MAPRYIIALIAAIVSCNWTEAVKYTLEFAKDDPLEPCDEKGFTFVDEIVDLSNFNFYRDDNDDLTLAGSFKIKKDVGTLEMILEGKRQERGNWVQMMSIVKYDVCEFITTPGEVGEEYLSKMTPKECPLKADVDYTISPTVIKFEYETPYQQGRGDMFFTMKLLNKEKGVATCVRIFAEIH